jgi:hypothetical protein
VAKYRRIFRRIAEADSLDDLYAELFPAQPTTD